MTRSESMYSLVGAVVGAGAYEFDGHDRQAAHDAFSAEALADVRAARVELYCVHTERVLDAIRDARHHLEMAAGALPSGALTALDRAAWHARRDHFDETLAALESALAQML